MFGITAAALAALSAVASAAPTAPSAAANSSDTEFPELAHFFSNNSQWANAKAKEDPNFFPTLNASQHPGIVWIGCSDSRVPESVITHQDPGSIFTHRNIANQIQADDWNSQAVVEYAVGHLNVSHVVIVGHTNCGGAAAAFAAPNPDANKTDNAEGHKDDKKGKKDKKHKGDCFHPKDVKPGTEPGLDNFLAPLIKLRWTLPEGATAADLIVANVNQSVNVMAETNAIQNEWKKNKRVCVHGWLYDIGTGMLKDLGFSRCK